MGKTIILAVSLLNPYELALLQGQCVIAPLRDSDSDSDYSNVNFSLGVWARLLIGCPRG
jgi:hypothetical protein